MKPLFYMYVIVRSSWKPNPGVLDTCSGSKQVVLYPTTPMSVRIATWANDIFIPAIRSAIDTSIIFSLFIFYGFKNSAFLIASSYGGHILMPFISEVGG